MSKSAKKPLFEILDPKRPGARPVYWPFNSWTTDCVEVDGVPTLITIEIPGAPVPSMRKRASILRTRKGPRVHMYTPTKGASYAERVALFAGIAAQKAGWKVEEKSTYSVRFEVHRATMRGDFDNFEKALTDPMNGIIWKDDSQITEWSGKLLLDRKNPRAIVRVERRVK